MSKRSIGVIGAGPMGWQIARRLCALGYHVQAYDQDPASAERLTDFGVCVVRVPAELAESADAVILTVAHERAAENAIFDSGGVTETLPFGHPVVDLSGVGANYGVGAARRLEAMGLRWVEATLLGRPRLAEPWSLCLAAGETEDLRSAGQLLLGLAQHVAMLPCLGAVSRMRPLTSDLADAVIFEPRASA